jgi:hypothetical protein
MSFGIQVGNPKILSAEGIICSDLRGAIEEIFPLHTERALLVWNHIYIPICYKYDLSILIDDIIPLLTFLLEHEEGEYRVNWGSNTFHSDWIIN